MLSNIDFGSYFHTKKYEKGLSTGRDKIADWGGSKGGWGGHVPPSLYVKRGPAWCCMFETIWQIIYIDNKQKRAKYTSLRDAASYSSLI